MLRTIEAHDISLAEGVTIPVSSMIDSILTAGGDPMITFSGTNGTGWHFTLNGVVQDSDFPLDVPLSQLNQLTFTTGLEPGHDYLDISTADNSFDVSIIVFVSPTGNDPIVATTGAAFFGFHAGGTVNQTFIGNGNHDTITMPSTASSFSVRTSTNGDVVFTEGGGPSFTLEKVEQVQFTDSTKFIENADNANIARLYSAAFDRVPDGRGLAFWEDVYARSVPASAKAAGYYVALAQTNDGSGTSIAGGFMQSSEFINKYGSLTDFGFINAMYQNVLGRGADDAGASFWLNQLSHGTTREMVLVGFAESPENMAKTSANWLIQI